MIHEIQEPVVFTIAPDSNGHMELHLRCRDTVGKLRDFMSRASLRHIRTTAKGEGNFNPLELLVPHPEAEPLVRQIQETEIVRLGYDTDEASGSGPWPAGLSATFEGDKIRFTMPGALASVERVAQKKPELLRDLREVYGEHTDEILQTVQECVATIDPEDIEEDLEDLTDAVMKMTIKKLKAKGIRV